MGALMTLDISKNKLTTGALKAGKRPPRGDKKDWEDYYETDMTGTATAGC
jgi:hypothetical protein